MAGIILLVLALCRPYWADEGRDVHVMFLVDVSESVDLAAAHSALDEIRKSTERLRLGDSWSLFAVGQGLRPFDGPDELGKIIEEWQEGVGDDRFRSASQLGDAMLSARFAFPAGKARRIVLYSDGQETDGDISEALRQMREERIDARLNRVSGLDKPEAAVVSVQPSSPFAFHGEVVRMTVRVAANRSMNAKLRMIHKGVVVQQRDLQLAPDRQNLTHFDIDMTTPGATVWQAELIAAEDHFPINNQSACTVTVRGKPRILVLDEKPQEMRPFARALKQQEFEIDVRGKFGMPDTLEGMLEFDAIVLANLAATSLQPRQMDRIKRYVIDFGGGLAMFGSENSFGLGGYYKTPVEEVLPLVSRFEKEKEKPSLAMVLVIDKSGSMQGLPIALARQAAKAAVELLSVRDMVGVVGFDGQPFIVSEIRSAAEAEAIQASIDSLDAGGGTYMYPAMVSAKEMLENAPAKIRHMILLSDGHTQAADHEGLTQSMVDAGITLSTVALGGADRQLLAGIAEIGRGRYYETTDPESVPQIFTKETMQASRSAIKEDLFGTVQTGDHPALAGFREADLPFSLGYVMTEAKPTAQVLLVAETGDPLLAVARYGLGTGLAYTSDLTERWGGEWLAWEDCGQFWAQALRSVVRKADTEGLQVASRTNVDDWWIDMGRVDAGGRPVSGIDWDTTVLDENGKTQPVAIREVGLGRYQARIPLDQRERLTVRLRDPQHEKLKVLYYHRPYPSEYRLSHELPSGLAQLASIDADRIRDDITPERHRKSVAHYAVLAALTCLFAGVLLRRL